MQRAPEPDRFARRSYRPEQPLCPACRTPLRRHHMLWCKNLVLLEGLVRITNWGYGCPNPSCSAASTVYRSAEAEPLHLAKHQFGRDVIAQVGYWRFWQHMTVTEIHQHLTMDLRLPISQRQVLDLLADFLVLRRAAQPARIAAWQPPRAQGGGLIVGIDGMQPEKGTLCLYLVREPRLGLTLLAESLEESGAANLPKQLLEPLKTLAQQLELPILGVVSDAQESIRLAVAAVLPGVPHPCGHYHCLRDAGAVTFQADRALQTDRKPLLRQPLGRVEARLGKLSAADPLGPVRAGYAVAIRATLLEGGVAPFAWGGIRVFDDLSDLAASLVRCREKGGIRSWSASSTSPTCGGPWPSAETNWSGNGSGSWTWRTSWSRSNRHRVPPKWPSRLTAT